MNPTAPPSAATIALIERALTDDLLVEAVAYAAAKLRGLAWRGRQGGAVPGGREAADMVQTAVERTLSGRRKWDPVEVPEFNRHLTGAIDSIVSALVVGAENRRSGEIVPYADESEAACIERLLTAHDYSGPTREEESANSEFMLAVTDEVGKDDPPLQRILECMLMDEIYKREAIANHLGITPDDVTNATKRFKRRWPKLVAQFANLNPPKVSP